MVFSSLFFVFFFFALNLIAYNLAGNIRQKNMVLLVFSLIFYSWGGPKYLLLLVSMVFASWGFALMIERAKDAAMKRWYLIGNCVFMLGLLGIFKYLTFFAGVTHSLFSLPKEVPQIALPVGISFYTFQLLSYVIDVYRGEIQAQKKFWYLLLYASLFHQCIAGPIVRYQLVADEIEHRRIRLDEFGQGIKRFSIGLAKKAVLANGCASVADTLVPSLTADIMEIPAAGLWVGILFYALQIYLDFAAYSDMAIGMGLMVGFHYNENFDYPYIANSVKDFWRRWHISLSTFFRDYVYIPLGGNRQGKGRTYLNLLIVWCLTGIWHGNGWNFLIWGLFLFAVIAIEKLWIGRYLNRKRWLGHLYMILLIPLSWLIFAVTDLRQLGIYLGRLVGIGGVNVFAGDFVKYLEQYGIFLVIGLLFATGLPEKLFFAIRRRGIRWVLLLAVLAGSLYGIYMGMNDPFLYFQF